MLSKAFFVIWCKGALEKYKEVSPRPYKISRFSAKTDNSIVWQFGRGITTKDYHGEPPSRQIPDAVSGSP